MSREYDRRTFIKNSLAATAGLGLMGTSGLLSSARAQASGSQIKPIPKRPLGKTGEMVSIYGVGGLFTPSMSDRRDETIEIANYAIDAGINYFDTSAVYGDGASETNLGVALQGRRDEIFLASKSHDYTYDGTMRLIEQSLNRLQTDHLDLYQHHLIGRFGQLEDLQKNDSARRAFEQLRDEGTIRFIGITGHSSKLLADALEDYPYDCALITLNPANAVMDDPEHLDRFFQIAQEKEVGVIAMKLFERGDLVNKGFTAKQLLYYAMSYPISTAIVGISRMEHLEENIRLTRDFEPLSEEELAEIRAIAGV